MLRTLAGIAICIAVFLGALALGLGVASRLAPERLRVAAEEALGEALGSPVSVDGVGLALRNGFLVRADGVSTWRVPGGAGEAPGPAGLTAARVEARLSLLALLTGEIELDRLTLVDARLVATRSREGIWSPAPLATLFARPDPDASPHPKELLGPLIALEGAVRQLLEDPRLAGVLELRGGRLDWVDHAAAGGSHELSLRDLEARLTYPRLRGGARVRLGAELFRGEAPQGRVEWTGSRGRTGPVRTSIAATALELASLSPYLDFRGGPGRLEGELSGVAAFETPEEGQGRLELDLLASRLLAHPRDAASGASPLRAESAAARLAVSIRPDSVHLERARLSSGDLDLQLEGVVARPLSLQSVARLAVSLSDVELARALDYLGWLPASGGSGPRQRVEAGRLTALTARGTAPLERWRRFFSGRAAKLPDGFAVDAELSGARVRVGDRDRLEDLRAAVHWSGDQVEIRDGRALLNGSPLPALDLTLDGVSHLFATDPARRALSSGGEPLVGLRNVWELLGGEEEPGSAGMETSIWLEIASLEHPMFLWPIADVWAEIEPGEGGVHIAATKGTWAGAPIRGEADWRFDPEERVRVRMAAEAPEPGGAPRGQGFGWAHGRFTVGEIAGRSWRQQKAMGTFSADGSTVHLSDLEIELPASGRLLASGVLDLGVREAVPFQVELSLEEGDLGTLTEMAGLDPGAATGRAHFSGRFRGRLGPDVPFFAPLSGSLSLTAEDGTLRRSIPPVLAAALASDSLNPFAGRELVRYHRVRTDLEFTDGVMSTDSFALDGPDLRLLASGSVDLANEPHHLEAEVAVFLFRMIDRALGKIPLVNALLLGEDESIQAAYYELSGPWADPDAKLVPLRTMASGPASLVLERVPRMLRRGLEALGGLLGTNGTHGPTGENGGGAPESPGDEPPARAPRSS